MAQSNTAATFAAQLLYSHPHLLCVAEEGSDIVQSYSAVAAIACVFPSSKADSQRTLLCEKLNLPIVYMLAAYVFGHPYITIGCDDKCLNFSMF